MTIAMTSSHCQLFLFFVKLNFQFFFHPAVRELKKFASSMLHIDWKVTKHEAKKFLDTVFNILNIFKSFLCHSMRIKWNSFRSNIDTEPPENNNKEKNCLITFDIRHQFFFIYSLRYTILLHNILYYVNIYDRSAVCNDIRYFFHSAIVDLQ